MNYWHQNNQRLLAEISKKRGKNKSLEIKSQDIGITFLVNQN